MVGGLAYMCCNAELLIFNHMLSTLYRAGTLAYWVGTNAAHYSGTQVVTYHPQTSGTCLGLSWFLMGYEAALAMPHMPCVSAALRAILKKPPSPQPAPLHHTHSHFTFQLMAKRSPRRYQYLECLCWPAVCNHLDEH